MTSVAAAIVVGVGAYLLVGALVATPFVLWRVGRIDGAARSAGVLFRLLIWPGCCALWPLALVWWRRPTAEPAHAEAAA